MFNRYFFFEIFSGNLYLERITSKHFPCIRHLVLLFAAILDPNNRDNTPTHNCVILSDHTFKHKNARLMASLRQCPSLNILQLQRPSLTQIKTKLGLEIFKKKLG